MPQIEVTFNIHHKQYFECCAQDKALAKSNPLSLRLQVVYLMKKSTNEADAEKYAEEDKVFRELVDKNKAESLILGTQKAMKELGDDKIEQVKKQQ